MREEIDCLFDNNIVFLNSRGETRVNSLVDLALCRSFNRIRLTGFISSYKDSSDLYIDDRMRCNDENQYLYYTSDNLTNGKNYIA